MFNLNAIHSRHSVTRLIFHFFLVYAFSARPPKAFPTWMLPPNELMVDPPDEPSVNMAKIEASVLDLLMVSSKIVASSADFSRLFLFHYFRLGRPLCRVIEISLLRLAASQSLWISSQWGLTESLNHYSQVMCHEIATRYCYKRPDLGLLLILFHGLTLQMPFGRCKHLWTAPYSQYLVVLPYTVGLVLKLYLEGSEILH